MGRQRVGLISLAVCLLLGGLALGTVPASGKAAAKKTLPLLRLGYNVGVDWNATLDPANTQFVNDADTEYLMNAGLVKINTNGRIKMDGAQSVKISRNRKVFTFTLRKNLRFANGRYVTASAFVWSLTRAAGSKVDPQEATTYDGLIEGLNDYNAGKASSIKGLKALNSRTLRITITKPAVYFLAMLAYPTDFVLDRHVVGGHPIGTYLTNTCAANVGAGPFTPICQNESSDSSSFYAPGTQPVIHLVPNTYFYGRKPHIRIDLPVISSNDRAYAEYKAGEIDTSGIPVTFISSWRKKKDFHEWGNSVIVFIVTDVTTAPFNNLHCRLALAHAIDHVTLAKKILRGEDKPLYTVVPSGFLGYYDGRKTGPSYNRAKARAELSQCPGHLQQVDWCYPVFTADARNVRNATEAMLKDVGINLRIVDLGRCSRDPPRPMRLTGQKIKRLGWIGAYPDPQNYLEPLLRTGRLWAIGGWNNKTFNRLVDRADLETNTKKRAAMYVRAQKIAISKAVFIPEFNGLNFMLIKPYVHGLVGTSPFDDIMPKNQDWSKVSVKRHS